ncbi:hypothetical protein QZN08_03935 [Burkholderia multivorans]|nr:hypothetical protein [Burkholderia multivorans]
MKERAYFDFSQIPEPVQKACMRRVDHATGDRLISFVGCPFTGREVDGDQIEIPFPRNVGLRETLIDWLLYWGIPFRVLP